MRRIKKLPSNLVNRIAAGEVIERPASALKELMENSIDAGATHIEVSLSAGGIDQIKVTDNGAGIYQEDLALAIDRHATSKIYDEDELYLINTLGFRGEGLASIASVSNFSLASRTLDNNAGYQIKSKFGIISEIVATAMNHGSSVIVNELYHTIPARKKFMKSEATEYGHCKNVFQRLALSNPEIHFTLKHNQKVIFDLPAEPLSARIGAIYGDTYVTNALNVLETSSGVLSISGYVYHPNSLATNNIAQYFFVNRRYIRDKVIQNALKQGFAGVLHNNHNPAYVLFLEIDPREIDVNVHPTKTEIRFRESGAIHSFISNCVRKALAIINTGGVSKEIYQIAQPTNPALQGDIAELKKEANPTPQAKLHPSDRSSNFATNGKFNNSYDDKIIKQWLPKAQAQQNKFSLFDEDLSKNSVANSPDDNKPLVTKDPALATLGSTDVAGGFFGNALAQLHGIYILAQNEEGLLVVDIHAAHERILLENLQHQVSLKQVIKQELLLPIELTISSLMLAIAKDYHQVFMNLGFEFVVVNEAILKVQAIPALLAKEDVTSIVVQTLDELLEYGNSHKAQASISDILSVIACHSAIRANDYLSIPEMNSLLRQMEQIDRASYCNHGRPTWFKITMQELDSMFMRGR